MPAGRPRKQIDREAIRKLAALHCTLEEIAAFVGCSTDTIQRNYAAEVDKGRQEGKKQLRDWQIAAARKGNVAMLIFLGKQYLGQSDKIKNENENISTVQICIGLPQKNER